MELIDRIKAWVSPVDWGLVFQAELPRVYNYFRYQGLDDPLAEDLTAITFEKAWRARDAYRREKAAVSTWLIRIARNVAIDHYRSRQNWASIEEAERVVTHPGPERLYEQQEDVERLRELLAGLSSRERELVALKYGAGLTNRAIARETGLSESNVGTILQRVVRNLRAQWEQLNER